MSDNVMEFEWTATKEQAAVLLAQDNLSDEAIASILNIACRTLYRWKTSLEFQARIRVTVEQFRNSAMSEGVADKVNRVRALNDRWQRMNRLLKIREKSTPDDVLGRETGLLVRREKVNKWGTTVEFEVDTGLLAELRAVEQQTAKELGQWAEKSEVSIGDNGIIQTLERRLLGIIADGEEKDVPLLPDERGSKGA